MKQLLRFPEVFYYKIYHSLNILMQFYLQVFRVTTGFVELNPAFRDYESRTNRVFEVLSKLRHENIFVALKGWRDEVSNFFKLF